MGTMSPRDVLMQFVGKRVFLTGHTGFKGSWLAYLLQEIGAEVLGFALPPATNPNHFTRLNLSSKIKHVEGDIRDAGHVKQVMQAFQPEYVFHLAAQALVKKAYHDPLTTIETNVLGSTHILEAVRLTDSVRSLVFITSDKCYENVEWIWGYRENDLLGGHDPYSASKAAAENIFSAYARSFFQHRPALGAASARAGNVIGGGDWAADRIVPDCIRAIERQQPVELRNPYATRPWQHVLEPISGYLLLAARLYEHPKQYAGSWNFGPSTQEVRTVNDVTSTIIQHLGQGRIDIASSVSNQHEANLLQLNCDKAHQLLNWYPRWRVEKTLEATAHWYKVMLEGGDVENVTRTQIYQFFQELS